MNAQQMNIDVISNNLANVNTPGFKRVHLNFEDVMYSTEKAPGSPLSTGDLTPKGLQVGYGSKPASTSRSFSQGDLQATGGKTDLAVQGSGFFQILYTQSPDGFAYTRDGSFTRNDQGILVNNSGYQLANSPTFDPQATEVTIASDGTVSQTVNGVNTALGTVQLARFPNPEGLRALGENLYVPTEGSGASTVGNPGQEGLGTIAQGYLESSNVRVVEEMVKMIQAQRAYEINSKSIQSSDEMMGIANNLRR